MASLTANSPVGESSYGSAGPGFRVEARVAAAADEFYVGQILQATAGLVHPLADPPNPTSGHIYGICTQRHTAAANSSDRITVERDARYWIYDETLAVDANVDKILYADTDNWDDLSLTAGVGPAFGRIVMVENGVRMLVDTSRGACADVA